jgi:O-antigen/teichoic acid export membrane protein
VSPAVQLQGARLQSVRVSRTLGQTALYTGTTTATSLLGGIAKTLLARLLTVSAFGVFSFATSFLQLAAMLFEFGLFAPASRLVARSEPRAARELLGAALVAFLPIGLAFTALVFGFSFLVDSIFRVHAGVALAISAPLAAVYPFSFVALQLTQGADRLHIYSVANVAGQVMLVATLLVLTTAGVGRNATVALVVRCGTLGLGWLMVIIWLRPAFTNVRKHVSLLVGHARDYGFQIYVGRVLSVGTYNMDVLMLAALTNARTVGLYTLAGAVAAVIGIPAQGLASALFPKMVNQREIDRRWLAASWAVGLAGVGAAALLASPFVGAVFSSSYSRATEYVVPLALAQAVRSVTGIYNSYLSAQALGRTLRNTGIVLTVSNLVLNLLLIPPYGAAGAAWASVLALLFNLAAHIIGYRRHLASAAPAPAPDRSNAPVRTTR